MHRIVVITLISLVGLNFVSLAQGNLLVTPTRVVFEGNKQREEINLVNMGKDSASYSISFVQKNMKEDGHFENIMKPDSGQMFADAYLRIFPRSITLAPGEPQVIILQCRRTSDMKAGEYRSHLFFRSQKDNQMLGMGNTDVDTTKLSVELIPNFGVSIPIIIRTGTVNVSSSLSDLKLVNLQSTTPGLFLSIYRTGNISIYGDIIVQFVPKQGKPVQIGTLTGVGVYTNLNKRNVIVKFKNTGTKLENGILKVQYVSNDESKKPVVYAEAVLDI